MKNRLPKRILILFLIVAVTVLGAAPALALTIWMPEDPIIPPFELIDPLIDPALLLKPFAPTNLVAAASLFIPQIELTWQDNSNNEDSFVLYRAKEGFLYAEYKTLPANTTSYSDTGLDTNTKYFYKVYAKRAIGVLSDPSNTASATTSSPMYIKITPDDPTNLTADAVSSSKIQIAWQDESTNESGFKIERKTGLAPFAEIATVGANVTSYSSTGLAANTMYSYRVIAYNSLGSSAYSNTASDTTNPLPAGTSITTMRFYIGSSDYFVDDQIQTMDTSPIIKESRTVLPIRYVVEPLGGDVQWDNIEKMVTITMGSKIIKLWINNNTANVNGTNIFIDPENANVMPILIPPGRTMLPLRFIAENLGCEVSWLPIPKEVTVMYEAP